MSSEPLFAIIDALPVLISYLDREQRYRFTNKTHVQWFGRACEDLLGRSLRDVIGESAYAVVGDGVARALAGERFSFTGSLPSPDLGDRFVRVTFIPHREATGPVIGLVTLFEDLSDLGQLHERSPAASDDQRGRELDDRQRTDDATQPQQSELAQLMRVRTLGDMTAALAHELAQPLSATLAYIQGSLRMMRASDKVSTELIDYMDKAAGQARRAGEIVRHIRRYARREKPAWCAVDIGQLVHKAMMLLTAEAEAYGISLSIELAPNLPQVTVEAIAIEQAVLNLLHNSIEALASRPAAPGRIHIATNAASADAIQVSVSDNGPGIPAEVAGHIFEPFVTSKPGGSGLGLAICQTIVREHGGDLWLDNRAGPGATFVFSLPVRGAPSHENS